jgi:hypothetical protein
MAKQSHTEVYVDDLPTCDIHAVNVGAPVIATYDGRTTMGPWAYMCSSCFARFGVGLGLGKGQRLIVRPNVGTAS